MDGANFFAKNFRNVGSSEANFLKKLGKGVRGALLWWG